jgi:hypothetical protein
MGREASAQAVSHILLQVHFQLASSSSFLPNRFLITQFSRLPPESARDKWWVAEEAFSAFNEMLRDNLVARRFLGLKAEATLKVELYIRYTSGTWRYKEGGGGEEGKVSICPKTFLTRSSLILHAGEITLSLSSKRKKGEAP